ncbi:MAG: Type 1 glutamine amidotransferase-like domain-containing protein [Candidatus Berkelbacteria bacterium]
MANIFLTSSLQTVAKDLAKHLDPKVKRFLYVATASEVEDGDLWWLRLDRERMTDLGFELTDFTFTGKTKEQVNEALSKADGVVVAGGNTFHLLYMIQKSNSIELVKEFVDGGAVYIGSSAGSMVAGPDIYFSREEIELTKVQGMTDFKGLGITDIVAQPHWGSDSFKKSYLDEIMKNSYVLGYKQVLITDNQYIIDLGNNQIEIINVNNDN